MAKITIDYKRIADGRIKKRLTQKRLADLLGVKRQTVGVWEMGLQTPSLDNIEKIEKELEIDLCLSTDRT